MDIVVSMRHGQVTDEIKGYVEEKLNDVLDGRPLKFTRCTVVLDTQKSRQSSEIIISMKNHQLEATAETYDMREAIDATVAKIDRQIAKLIDKLQDHHGRKPLREIEEIEDREEEEEEEEE